MTNYEKIRTMSIEEMAELFVRIKNNSNNQGYIEGRMFWLCMDYHEDLGGEEEEEEMYDNYSSWTVFDP